MRGTGCCRDRSGVGSLHWVCTVVLLSFSCSNKCRKIPKLQIQHQRTCSFCLSPGDALCRTGHRTTASPVVLHPPWQRLWWARIKRDGRKMEPTNLLLPLGLGATYPGGTCPSGHLSSPWDFHHSLQDPTWVSATEPGSFTSVVCSTKKSSANSQTIIPKGRVLEDLIFMVVGMSCALQNTLQKRREGLGRDFSSQGHRLPRGKGKVAVYRDANSLQHPAGDQVN